MANERYEVKFFEWSSRPLIDLVPKRIYFKTRTEAVDFFNCFKDDSSIEDIQVVDTVTQTTIARNINKETIQL